MPDAELTRIVKERALELGFARTGVAAAERLEPEGARLRTYVAEGRHGEMAYMADTAEVRADPGHPNMLAGARSVLVLAAPYARPPAVIGPAPGRMARYAHGRDYHNVLNRRVRKLEKLLRGLGHDARASVDTRPVLERAWAQRAGLGFIGKNCCLIVPGIGSHVFLACVVTSAELVPDAPMKERCGSCTLCLDGCPTRAFVGPRELDARRCISYLTIEKRGPIAEELRAPIGDWVYGCDVCQDVCPYNRTSLPPEEQTAPFAADPRWSEVRAEDFLSMDEDSFRKLAEGSPVKRAGVDGFARNAAIVLGNRGDERHLPVLQHVAGEDQREAVRDAARWALEQIAE
ncbi:MAG: tRNA epoxyqueuosine(34) reductase QueG, partial [Polyangiaceae bacterium]|nr:tRNA epoxyqueuosine(34) reductase QueG [Polyangiaceae bacterium]